MTTFITDLAVELNDLTESNCHNHSRLKLAEAMVEKPEEFGLDAAGLEVAEAASATFKSNLEVCSEAAHTPWDIVTSRSEVLGALLNTITIIEVSRAIHRSF